MSISDGGSTINPPALNLEAVIGRNAHDTPEGMVALGEVLADSHVYVLGHPGSSQGMPEILCFVGRDDVSTFYPAFTRMEYLNAAIQDHGDWGSLGTLKITGIQLLDAVPDYAYVVLNMGSALECIVTPVEVPLED